MTFASFLWEKFELNFDKNQISLSVFIKTWGVKHWISFLDSVQSNLKKDLEQRIITGHDMQSTFGLNKLLSKSTYTCEVFKRNLKLIFFQIIVSLFYQAADQGAHRCVFFSRFCRMWPSKKDVETFFWVFVTPPSPMLALFFSHRELPTYIIPSWPNEAVKNQQIKLGIKELTK